MFLKDLHAEAQKLENAPKDQLWKKGCVNAELLFRNQFKSIEDAVQKVKNDGMELIGHLKDGKFYYADADGMIYYESQVVVH